jgi:hypothetical protein
VAVMKNQWGEIKNLRNLNFFFYSESVISLRSFFLMKSLNNKTQRKIAFDSTEKPTNTTLFVTLLNK